MWIVVMFDLPVTEKIQRKRATKFRKQLLEQGFIMGQYSVYLRPCPSQDNTALHVKRVRRIIPPEGRVRIIQITDRQFGRMQSFTGRIRRPNERMPGQLSLF